MVKLAKVWKRARRLKIGSYLTELLVARAFRDGIPQGRDLALNAFFAWMARGGLKQPIIFTDNYRVTDVENAPNDPLVVLDPTNPRNNVAAALSLDAVAELERAADRARARSGTALDATSRREAAACWRDLLVDFPVP